MSALSPTPNLEQLKKQAKDLRKAHKASDPKAASRIREHLPRLTDHSEQEILRVPFTLQEAQHVIARESGFRSWRELRAAAAPPTDPPQDDGAQSEWRPAFDAIYHLQSDEVLKRVPPPFIPERMEYYLVADPAQVAAQMAGGDEPHAPDTFFFAWDDETLDQPGSGYLDGWGFDLYQTLKYVLEINDFEYEGPQELMALKMPGDWICRRTASVEERIVALAKICSGELNRPIEFERVKVDRGAIVASGEFSFSPLRDSDPNTLYLYLNKEELADVDADGGGGGPARSINQFLHLLGNRVGIPVQNRVTNDFDYDLHCRHLRSSELHRMRDKEEKTRKLRDLLANISAQTALSFSLDQQLVHIWQFRERESEV